MPLRTKVRRVTPRRRTVAVSSKSKLRRPPAQPGQSKRAAKSASNGKHDHKHNGKAHAAKAHSNGVSAYTKALRFLNTLTDHERLRIVRYNNATFDLNRMRHLLKKIGNPHDDFKSVHIAGTKGKGSTATMTA